MVSRAGHDRAARHGGRRRRLRGRRPFLHRALGAHECRGHRSACGLAGRAWLRGERDRHPREARPAAPQDRSLLARRASAARGRGARRARGARAAGRSSGFPTARATRPTASGSTTRCWWPGGFRRPPRCSAGWGTTWFRSRCRSTGRWMEGSVVCRCGGDPSRPGTRPRGARARLQCRCRSPSSGRLAAPGRRARRRCTTSPPGSVFSYASIGQSISLVWPPTGLALAALVDLRTCRLAGRGHRGVPGERGHARPASAAAAIAAGNTLEAVVAASLVPAHAGRQPRLEAMGTVRALVLVRPLPAPSSAPSSASSLSSAPAPCRARAPRRPWRSGGPATCSARWSSLPCSWPGCSTHRPPASRVACSRWRCSASGPWSPSSWAWAI